MSLLSPTELTKEKMIENGITEEITLAVEMRNLNFNVLKRGLKAPFLFCFPPCILLVSSVLKIFSKGTDQPIGYDESQQKNHQPKTDGQDG